MDYDLEFFLVLAAVITGLLALALNIYRKSGTYDKKSTQTPSLSFRIADNAASFFPILLIVLLIRSFIIEPFRIPSGSMLPTLEIGDFIMVSKFTYGLKLPVLHNTLIEMDLPQRGDVVVFRYPKDSTKDYIKRVVGIPGDKVVYKDKQLHINGVPITQVEDGNEPYTSIYGTDLFERTEYLGDVKHNILVADISMRGLENEWQIPEANYFVMGDNRDNSNDSRVWGFVPERNLVGKAFLIWMNWNHQDRKIGFSRIGNSIR